jgi:nickel-dependent lactate racemase
MKTVHLAYASTGLDLRVPEVADVLIGQHVEAIQRPRDAVLEALARPIGSAPLADLIGARRPRSIAITISDITRPVPNRVFLPPLLDCLGAAGVSNRQIVIIIGTGMHRPSTPQEREVLVGPEVLGRIEVIDHAPHDPAALLRISDDPPISVNRRFAEADFRIVTGFIEPHFMAGYSGGRKGVCPALVDLGTIQRFHGYATLADPRADNGVLDGNPCHEIALGVARKVGVDFLVNVAITRDRQIAGVYAGDLEAAHEAGCRQVAEWTSAGIDGPYDLVVTSGGGLPLDATFYQTVKGMCGALPALGPDSTLLIVSECREQIGSKAYADLMLSYGNDWRRFLADIAASSQTRLDQWEFQMQCRVLERIGMERLWLVTDGIPADAQRRLGVTPILGEGDARQRAQRAIDAFVAARPIARVAVIPDGPYTTLKVQ